MVVRFLAGVVAFAVGVARRRRPLQGLVVVGLVFYGTWLVFRPAAFMAAGALLLLDLVTDRPAGRPTDRHT